MKRYLMILGIIGAGALGAAGSANAQGVRLGIGPSGVHVGVNDHHRGRHHRRWNRHHGYRNDCRVIVRKHINRRGERVVVRKRVCD
ncbi:hypothetical protein BH11PSE4_BH11PSE4_19220 [soil metagenome]